MIPGSSPLRFLFLFILIISAGPLPAYSQTVGSSLAQSPIPISEPIGHVEFDHHTLFILQPSGSFNGDDRAELANTRLQEAWSANKINGIEGNPSESVVMTQEGLSVMVNGKRIVTVTQSDTAASDMTDDQLAQNWQHLIDAAFKGEIREDSPEYMKTAIIDSCVDIGLGFSIFIIVLYVSVRLKARRLWSIYLAIWFYVAHLVISLFPSARAVTYDFWNGDLRPLFIIIYVAIPAGAVTRMWAMTLHVLFPPLPEQISSQDLIRRTNLRRRTLAGVAEVTGISLVWIVATVIVMSLCGFNPSSLLTSAGLIGVAIGLVAQDSIRDTLAGIYILSDDRYGVGDIIKVGEYEGRVERFNLRMTQIRDMSGRLITLSNRNTTEVANLTARWGQVDFRIGVSYYDDIDHALSVLEKTANDLAAAWPDKFLDTPQMIGVESFNDLNITLRIIVKTPPGDQSVVAHELRKRAKLAFDAEHISIINEQHKAT